MRRQALIRNVLLDTVNPHFSNWLKPSITFALHGFGHLAYMNKKYIKVWLTIFWNICWICTLYVEHISITTKYQYCSVAKLTFWALFSPKNVGRIDANLYLHLKSTKWVLQPFCALNRKIMFCDGKSLKLLANCLIKITNSIWVHKM